MRTMIALSCGLALVGSRPAVAAQANVEFNGLVVANCTLLVGTPGVLAASTDNTRLDSAGAGGLPGTVTATATGVGFRVTADAPTAFDTAPTGANTNVTFATSYSITGSTTAGNVPGTTATTLNPGVNVTTVNLSAEKSTGVFPGGTYRGVVVVRCE